VKYQVIVLPRAELDEAEIFDYLSQWSLAVAQRFVDRLQETLQATCSDVSPGMPFDSENPRLSGFRWIKVRDFSNHLIFFRVTADAIEVARILHGARDIETILDQ
jgi:toxin ParE1/3/4